MAPAARARVEAPRSAAAALADAVSCEVHDVWAWNLDAEFAALLMAASVVPRSTRVEGSGSVILAFDVEFPGFLHQEPRMGARTVRYQVLRENVDRLRPIQLGVAVAGQDGVLRGVWSFNLRFDVNVDLHSAKSVAFLRAAGIDFPRHAVEGIDAAALGQRLAASALVGWHARAPWWVTFSGFYDFGYLLRMLTRDKLPQNFGGFDITLSFFCPRRHELRDELPHGSLDSVARKHGLQRRGLAHTAGSDALLTLELFLTVAGVKCDVHGSTSPWWASASNCGMEENWDVQNMWYQGHPTWAQSWEGQRWEANSWEFHAPILAAATIPLLPR